MTAISIVPACPLPTTGRVTVGARLIRRHFCTERLGIIFLVVEYIRRGLEDRYWSFLLVSIPSATFIFLFSAALTSLFNRSFIFALLKELFPTFSLIELPTWTVKGGRRTFLSQRCLKSVPRTHISVRLNPQSNKDRSLKGPNRDSIDHCIAYN